jgi:hypothetical protein
MASIFGHLLRVEKFLAPKGKRGDFAAPLLGEVQLPKGQDPLYATNARGGFAVTRMSQTGAARFGFSLCPIDDELQLFRRFFDFIAAEARSPIRCKGVQVAVDRLRGNGLEAKALVVSAFDATEMLGKSDVSLEGPAGMVNGMTVLVADLPKGTAILTVAATRLGVYTRVGDHLGLLFQRVDQNVVVVDDVAG